MKMLTEQEIRYLSRPFPTKWAFLTAFFPLIFFGGIALLNFWRLGRLDAFWDGTLWRAMWTSLEPDATYGGGLFYAMTVLHQSVLMLIIGIIVSLCWFIGVWIKQHEARMIRRIIDHLRQVDPHFPTETHPEQCTGCNAS